MLSRKFFILLFLTFALPQNAMSGYGFGSSVDNSDASSDTPTDEASLLSIDDPKP